MLRIQLVVLLAVSATASAADLKILSVGSIEPGLGRIAEQFKRDTGHNITIQVDTAPGLTKRLASGETADILIATPAIIDDAAKAGKASASTRMLAARVGVGIAVRRGATVPDVKSVEAFRKALLASAAIVYNEGSSGIYLEGLFNKMGIGEGLKARTVRFPNGGQVAQRVTSGTGFELGFLPIPYIKANEATGLQFVGPLPGETQNYTSYEAVVMTGSKADTAARDFIRYIATPASKKTFAEAGID